MNFQRLWFKLKGELSNKDTAGSYKMALKEMQKLEVAASEETNQSYTLPPNTQ